MATNFRLGGSYGEIPRYSQGRGSRAPLDQFSWSFAGKNLVVSTRWISRFELIDQRTLKLGRTKAGTGLGPCPKCGAVCVAKLVAKSSAITAGCSGPRSARCSEAQPDEMSERHSAICAWKDNLFQDMLRCQANGLASTDRQTYEPVWLRCSLFVPFSAVTIVS
jgi:hypothetical protein